MFDDNYWVLSVPSLRFVNLYNDGFDDRIDVDDVLVNLGNGRDWCGLWCGLCWGFGRLWVDDIWGY